MMEVTTLNYGGSTLLTDVSDGNANGYKDVEDLANADLSGRPGLDASATKSFQIAVRLRESTDNDYQADGVDITMTFIMNQ